MSTPSIERLSVLIVEPSPQMASLVASMLRTLRIRLIQDCADAKSAGRLVQTRAFDVIIIDDATPPIGGVGFVKGLRGSTDSPSRQAAVIMMSSAPDTANIIAARDAGVTEFLRKPFATDHLRTRLVSIVSRPRDFVESPAYVGPDRRRREQGPEGEERRAPKPD
ncbi:Response regulator receiver domain-containing protein [Devosia enhydra]|uniref:Response regulator receiver domain-containing protein n=1 Tax=Devosia enhydra TaxID=665118 RepID=A0A1K2HWZ1_9HYPH|nr:response regulator [Devosia enhydra]SFZ83694.1 Response regulator receiver domain-containing protein [Devosia enhydra]